MERSNCWPGSELDRSFERELMGLADAFTLGIWLWGAPHPHSAHTGTRSSRSSSRALPGVLRGRAGMPGIGLMVVVGCLLPFRAAMVEVDSCPAMRRAARKLFLISGRRGRALGLGPSAAGPGRVGMRGRLRAGGVEPGHRSADPDRVRKDRPAAPGPAAQAWRTKSWPGGAGCRRDADTRPPAIAERRVRPCFLFPGGLRRAVGPASPAAVDDGRDRQQNL
jgi:hypothetical protein